MSSAKFLQAPFARAPCVECRRFLQKQGGSTRKKSEQIGQIPKRRSANRNIGRKLNKSEQIGTPPPCTKCRKRSAAKGVQSLFFRFRDAFGHSSVTFLTLLSLFSSLFWGRQRSGEGVVRRNGCPKGCFWRVCFFSAPLRFFKTFQVFQEKTLRGQRRNGLSKSTLLDNRFSARPLRRSFGAPWFFAKLLLPDSFCGRGQPPCTKSAFSAQFERFKCWGTPLPEYRSERILFRPLWKMWRIFVNFLESTFSGK